MANPLHFTSYTVIRLWDLNIQYLFYLTSYLLAHNNRNGRDAKTVCTKFLIIIDYFFFSEKWILGHLNICLKVGTKYRTTIYQSIPFSSVSRFHLEIFSGCLCQNPLLKMLLENVALWLLLMFLLACIFLFLKSYFLAFDVILRHKTANLMV